MGLLEIISEAQESLNEVVLPDQLDHGMAPWEKASLTLHLELILDQTLTAILLLSSWGVYRKALHDMGIEE